MKENKSNDFPFYFGFAHYGEEREVDATDGEKRMFEILLEMFEGKGYKPEQLRLVRKSDNYVAAAVGDYDIARFKATSRVTWIIFPYETGAVKHRLESVEDVYSFSDMMDNQIASMTYVDFEK